jgi:DNA-binding MarR family transcriptional regulator
VSTAARWLNSLEERSLVVRRDDPRDGRRTYLALTPEGAAKMSAFFDRLTY